MASPAARFGREALLMSSSSSVVAIYESLCVQMWLSLNDWLELLACEGEGALLALLLALLLLLSLMEADTLRAAIAAEAICPANWPAARSEACAVSAADSA